MSTSLGPRSEILLARPDTEALVRSRMRGGSSRRDAELAEIHRAARDDPQLAEEFVRFIAGRLTVAGSPGISEALRRQLDTEDLLQSVLTNLWLELGQVEFETLEGFVALLRTRARWKAIDSARSSRTGRRREDRRVERDPGDAGLADDRPSPLSELADREERERLAAVLARLSPRDRRILELHLAGASRPAIARELGLGSDATRKALERAIGRARAIAPHTPPRGPAP